MIRVVVELGRAFNLQITVEGIETRDQLDDIRTFDVDRLQGFYFARPLTEEALFERYFNALPADNTLCRTG